MESRDEHSSEPHHDRSDLLVRVRAGLETEVLTLGVKAICSVNEDLASDVSVCANSCIKLCYNPLLCSAGDGVPKLVFVGSLA